MRRWALRDCASDEREALDQLLLVIGELRSCLEAPRGVSGALPGEPRAGESLRSLLQVAGKKLVALTAHIENPGDRGDVFSVVSSAAEGAMLARALDVLREEERDLERQCVSDEAEGRERRDYAVIDPEVVAIDRIAEEFHRTNSAAQRLVSDAILLSRCTRVWNCTMRGEMASSVAVRIARELEHIVDPVKLAKVEERILDRCLVPGRCVRWSSGMTRRLHTIIRAIDPDALISADTRAERGREVRTWPQGPAESVVAATLPSLEAEAVWSAVDGLARRWGGIDGEMRTAAQRRADALVQLVTGLDKRPAADRTPLDARVEVCPRVTLVADVDPASPHRAFGGAGSATRARLDALLEASARAHVSVVPLRADAAGPDLHALTRGLVSVAERLAVETTYTPSSALRRLVVERDGTCRHPGCAVPAHRCDLDHVAPFDPGDPLAGGLTREDNLIALCRKHHRAKTHGDTAYRLDADGTVRADLGGHVSGSSEPGGARGIGREQLGLSYSGSAPALDRAAVEELRRAVACLAIAIDAIGTARGGDARRDPGEAPGRGPGRASGTASDEPRRTRTRTGRRSARTAAHRATAERRRERTAASVTGSAEELAAHMPPY